MSFLDEQLKDWPSVLRTLTFLAGLFSILLIFAVQLAKYANPSSVSLSATNGVAINFGVDNSLATMLVHPRGVAIIRHTHK